MSTSAPHTVPDYSPPPADPRPQQPLHVVFVMANNTRAPYFNWMADRFRRFPQLQLTVVCLFREKPQMVEEMAARGSSCYWIPYNDAHRKRDMLRVVPRLVRLLRRLKPDVVHSHLFDDTVVSMLAGRLAGIPVRVATKADTGYHYRYAPRWMWFDRLNNRNATHLVAISDECREFIVQHEGAPANKVTRIHHGIPFELMSFPRAEYQAELSERFGLQGRRVVGAISRFIDWKGYRYLIEAADQVRQRYPEVLFLFLGYGPQQEELEQLVRDKSLHEHVIVGGWVKPEQIPSLIQLFDVFAHAATLEPFGLVIAEAMLNGRPLVSTPTGAARDALVHLENGWLGRDQDAASLAEGILYMLDHPEQARQMGQRARLTAARLFNLPRMFEEHIALYRQALGQAHISTLPTRPEALPEAPAAL